MITTAEAAKRLGVSQRRVIALIQAGDLIAEQFGRQWLVDERSVQRRAESPQLRGRPKLGQKDLLALSQHTLMNREHPVLDFTYDRKSGRAKIERIYDNARWAPLGIGRRPRNAAPSPEPWHPPVPNDIDLAGWINRRSMPALRPEAARLLSATGSRTTTELMMSALGFNLSDQYWFRPQGSSATWSEMNFFQNPYTQTRPHRLPDSSTPGALEKHWERRRTQNWLVKQSSTAEEREPYNELLAARLLSRILPSKAFVPYKLEHARGRAQSACPTMATPDTEFISAYEVTVYFGISEGRDLYEGYARACEALGIADIRTALAKMIVCDHVMANFDRHLANFGLMRNAETLDDWRVAPLFDHGGAFFSRATMAELRHDRFTWPCNPFEEYPLAQLVRAEDFSWYSPDMLAGFADEVREVLGRNPNMPEEFADRAAFHVQRNIDAVNDVHAERIVR